jgi:small-conductance mechanosensitive channel
MAPIAVLVLLPATLIMESNVLGITIALAKKDPRVIFYLLVNSIMAYFVNLTNFLVTKHTSPLTLQVHYLLSVSCNELARDFLFYIVNFISLFVVLIISVNVIFINVLG